MTERTSDATVASTPVTTADATYQARHTGPGPLSITLVAAISECAGVDPMDFQLYTYLDPDSLDTLFEPLREGDSDERGWIEFHVLGHRAVIYSTGEIEISTQEPTVPDAAD